jgi:PTS system nitrogen regulatory IIA component
MQLDVRGAAAVLNVPQSTIYRWINERHLPAKGVEGQYRFARTELLEWATIQKVELSPNIFQEDSVRLSLVDALESGGVFYGVPGSDKDSVLRSVVDNMSLPEGTDAEQLVELFLAREATGSTAVGNGIAIPHPRRPLVLPVAKPMLSLCFLAEPIEFGAANGEPVHTLFVLLSPTIQMHLQMLARVACLLRDNRFQQILAQRKSRQEILTEARRVEKALEPTLPAKH